MLMRMTPKQYQLRCYSNKVHYVLNKEHQKDPLLTSNDVRRLLSKTPRFIPAPRKISGTAVADDCYKFGYRLVKAFDRFVRKDNIRVARDTAADFGFVQWTPKQFPFPRGYYKDFVTKFFQTPLDLNHPGLLWRDNWDKCPDLPRFITTFREDVMTNVEVINRGTASRSNLSKNEKELLNKLKEYQIGFNISDKNFGPVLYSRDEYLQQCRLHLHDDKGTYEAVALSRNKILEMLLEKLTKMLRPYCQDCPAIQQLARNFLKWARHSVAKGTLCRFYIVWKLHKGANSRGVRSRPIAPNIGYITGQISQFLHCQLADAVFKHQFVLKDSLSLIRQLESIHIPLNAELMITSADVAALYPSIDIEQGLAALDWFIKEHTTFPDYLRRFFLDLARFVLGNNYVECEELEGPTIFQQKIGTAMGTTFSVTYATIFMIWLETPIINEFRQHILLYKRYIDDLFVVWSGSLAELSRFRSKFNSANGNISLEWQDGFGDTINPDMLDRTKLRRTNFLDLDIRLQKSGPATWFEFSIYRKPGNAYSYLPYGSYHARHIFRGWLKAEVQRLLTHSSTPEIWMKEVRCFYEHLRARGYPAKAIRSTFAEVSWNQRKAILDTKRQRKNESFFQTYRGCVFTTCHAPGVRLLQQRLDLSLRSLQDCSTGDIFPSKAFFAIRSAPRLGCFLRR